MTNPSKHPLARLIAPYRGLGPSLWSMFFATMINRFGDFVGVFLALYMSTVLGYDPIRTGSMVSLVYGVSIVGSLASGRIADVLGRKRTLILCQVTGALANVAMSYLYKESWASWLLVAGSLFRGGARPLIGAVLTDLAPAEKRKEVFGLQYWSINVGVALGPLVAAQLFNHYLPWLFRGDAICTLVSVVLVARGVRMPPKALASTSLEKHDERGAVAAFLGRPILIAFAALALLSSLTYGQTGFGLPLRLSEALGAEGPSYVGYMMSLNAVIVLALSIPIARLLRSRSPLECMAMSGGFFIVGFAMLAFPIGKAGFAASTVIWTLGEIVTSINMGVFLAKHSPANWRGSFQSFMGVFYSGGWTLGPLIAGPVLQGAGSRALWAGTAALCLVWALGAAALEAWDRRIKPEPEAAINAP